MAAPRPPLAIRTRAGEAQPSPLREDADGHDLTGFDVIFHIAIYGGAWARYIP